MPSIYTHFLPGELKSAVVSILCAFFILDYFVFPKTTGVEGEDTFSPQGKGWGQSPNHQTKWVQPLGCTTSRNI